MEIVERDPPSVDQIRDRHDRLLAQLRAGSEANGHDPDRLRIVAITKGHPLELVRRAATAGLTVLGENRVQEAEPKIAAAPDAEWHLVGQLQSNKERRAVRAFNAIHSVASAEQLERVAHRAADEAHRPVLIVQVNVTGETTKSGIGIDDVLVPAMVVAVREAKPAGLMTIAPMGASVEQARATFARLRRIRDELEQAAGVGMPELSMGMSADADAAAAEGATMVRLGTAIFGPRA